MRISGISGTFTTDCPYPEDFVPAILQDTWRRYKAGEKSILTGVDGFPVFPENPYRDEHVLLGQLYEETKDKLWNEINPKELNSAQAIVALPPASRVKFILAVAERLPWFWKTQVRKKKCSLFGFKLVDGWTYDDAFYRWNARPLLNLLLRKAPPFTEKEFCTILSALHDPPDSELSTYITPKTILRLADELWGAAKPEPVMSGLIALEKILKDNNWGNRKDEREVREQISLLRGEAPPDLIIRGEAWSNAAIEDLKMMSRKECGFWTSLLEACRKATGSKPTQKWLKQTKAIVEEIGPAKYKETVLRWFQLVTLLRPVRNERRPHLDFLICENNTTLLRGLVWCFIGWKEADISSALSQLGEVCFKKVPNVGPRCPRVGNACVYVLSVTASDDAASQLTRLDSIVKQPSAKRLINKSLDAAALITGQTRVDLEEKSLPHFGLNKEGELSRQFGEYVATIRVIGGRDVEIGWAKKDGKQLKAAPAEVKQSFKGELAQLKKLVKDIEKMLAAQRIRIERLLATEREWDFASWRQRYLEHPLIAQLVRRLIWHFKAGDKTGLAIWFDGKLVDVNSQPLDWLAPETRVRLWHPIGFEVDTVAGWRRWLEEKEISQPFKQAHREIYVLTDAELQTAVYSNRFAAHIIRQHQFAALTRERGWQYQLMGGFDFQSTPSIQLPHWNLAAEFWVTPTEGLSDSGISLSLATDQVRFVRESEAVSLSEVPAVVFSEIMRDVDLFVGVCSIGNDPEWRDAGAVGGEYWQTYSFGALTESAKTRREVLERLMPKLRISKQCSFQDKFLVVKGSVRTYKIHLGSGNILMAPNDQYLCIVPGPERGANPGEKAFLPFEGDRTLSIILSKAFLLANDTAIKDPTILSQIRR